MRRQEKDREEAYIVYKAFEVYTPWQDLAYNFENNTDGY